LRWPFWVWLLVVAIAFILLPGHPLAPLPGLPLDAPSVVVLALIGILFFGWTPRHSARADRYLLAALVVLCVLKVGTHAAAVDYGLRAEYFTRATDGTLSSQRERSIDYRELNATRLDRGLRFTDHNIPVYFWNELRFNWWMPTQPDRFGIPVRAIWTGFLYVPSPGEYGLRLTARGPAELQLGGTRLAITSPAIQTTTVTLNEGIQPIAAAYLRPEGAPVLFEAAWDRGGGFEPLAAPFLLSNDSSPARWNVSEGAQRVGVGLVALYAGLLAALAFRLIGEWWRHARPVRAATWERPLLALVLLAGLAWAHVESWPMGQGVWVFNGGEDWLTFESNARDIVLNGPLMLRGQPPGHAGLVSEQPGYNYALAGLHLLAGESIYGPVTVQLLVLPIQAILVYYIARRLFGRPAAVAALVLFGYLGVLLFKRSAYLLLSENLVQLMLPVAVLALLALVDRPRLGRALFAGVCLGLVVFARYTALLYVPIALASEWWSLSSGIGRRRASLLVGLILLGVVAVLSLTPMRNAVAAGTPAWMPTSAAENLERWRPRPDWIDFGQIQTGPLAPLYRLLGLRADNPYARAAEHLRQAPDNYIGVSLHWIAYAVGLHDMDSWAPQRPEFLPVVLLYLLAWLAWRETARPICWLVHGFVISHLVVLGVFGINAYPPRLVLPMYGLMPTVSGFGAVVLARLVVHALRLGRVRVTGPTTNAPPAG
jgi:hypothetical protein